MPSDEAPADKPSARFITVSAEHAGQRVDNFLHSELKGVPKSLVYRILRTGEVRINKGRAKPDTRVALGDIVRIPPLRMSEEKPLRIGSSLTATLTAAVVYEDDALIVLDKPAGLPVHAGSGVNVGVIEAMRLIYPQYPGLELAHRIDRETSGILVLAKDRPTLLVLHALFRDDAVHKTYQALVHGAFPDELREVDAPLEKSGLRSGERMVEVRSDGKPSTTRFRVLARLRGTTLIEARPLTGRTHQIRVHAAHAGYPLVGDAKYGDPERDRALKRFGPVRLFLHAVKIQLPGLATPAGAPAASARPSAPTDARPSAPTNARPSAPTNARPSARAAKKELRIEAPLPDDLTRLLRMLEGPDDDAG